MPLIMPVRQELIEQCMIAFLTDRSSRRETWLMNVNISH
jgi:hypothetical protein